jgi:hypothetical protein
MDLRKIRWEAVEWIIVAPDGNQWQVLVNRVTNL